MSTPSIKKNAKDQRPKVISFRTTLNGLDIAAKQDILWPCHAFSISIPQKKKSALNVFEQTILKVTEVESGDTENIAQLTCLERELVSFIQNRLNQLGLLDERYELSEHGQELLNEWRNNSEGNLEYIVATIFVDLVSGKILPYINTEQLNYKRISKITDSGYIEFLINPTNEKSKVSAKQIPLTKDSHWKVVPNSNDIIRAIRQFQIKYKRHALLNQGIDQYPPPVPMAEAISLHDNPQLVYLHCRALIQIGSSDLLVTDGYGFGFSEAFSNYLISRDWKWIINLKSKGVVDRVNNSHDLHNKSPSKQYKYKEISKRISYVKKYLDNIDKSSIDSTHSESDYQREIETGIKNLYASFEWALRQVVSDYSVPEWGNIFSSQNYKENEKLLYGFAEKLGFSVNDNGNSVLQVKPGAIRQIERGKVELQPLLALSLAGAISNSAHPFHSLAINHPYSLDLLLRLKKYRDSIEHGSSSELDIDKNTLEELINKIIPMIVSLIPAVADDLRIEGMDSLSNDINQERHKADLKIVEVLGTAFTYSLPTDIRRELIRSEIMLEKYSDDKAIEIIKNYCSVMQHTLHEVVKNRKIINFEESNISKAIERILESGFYNNFDAIPKQISTVNPKRLDRAARGSSSTLGAHLLAIFLLGLDNELVQLKSSDPEIVNFLADLIRLRGHGNQQLYDFPINDINSLRANTFKAIKTISEIF